MHILLGLLTTVITILYLLDRMGIDLGGLNPFYWRRRRAWAAKYQGDPIYSVDDPMEVAALLVAGVGKLDGDLSAEQKKTILGLFESNFSLASREAADLLGSATHLLGAPQIIDTQLSGVVDKNKGQFSPDQAESTLQMMSDVAAAGGEPTSRQLEYIAKVRQEFMPAPKGDGAWS